MENDTGEHRSDWVRLELEICNDAEVAATAAYCPKEIVMLRDTGGHESSVCENDLRGKQVVEGKAMLAHEPTEPTAEGQPGHAGNRNEAARGREPVRLECVVNLTPV